MLFLRWRLWSSLKWLVKCAGCRKFQFFKDAGRSVPICGVPRAFRVR
nr:MAG TPA: Putative toxin VapC6 domain, ZN ribbon domain [Caudoviricetes sp.]DAO15812.1 MAG TPA: Putative toxin VapC6 domain, ZN ribbon domain [Caudoviricetes sp.]